MNQEKYDLTLVGQESRLFYVKEIIFKSPWNREIKK